MAILSPFGRQRETLCDARFHFDYGSGPIRRDVDGATVNPMHDKSAIVHALLRGCYEGGDVRTAGPAVWSRVSCL